MSQQHNLPNDENGRVLRRMLDDGDDFSTPRNIDYEFIFEKRSNAIGFAEILDDKELDVSIGWFDEKGVWNVKVTRYMCPSHEAITRMENQLIEAAQPLDGYADGWGCFVMKPKLQP